MGYRRYDRRPMLERREKNVENSTWQRSKEQKRHARGRMNRDISTHPERERNRELERERKKEKERARARATGSERERRGKEEQRERGGETASDEKGGTEQTLRARSF